MNSFAVDLIGKICNETQTLVSRVKRNTVFVHDVESACRLVLPAELSKFAALEGWLSFIISLIIMNFR